MRDAMRNRRLEMKQSQTDIARLMDVSPGFYANIERGVKKPSADNLMLLEAIFGVPAAVLMKNEAPQDIPTEYADK